MTDAPDHTPKTPPRGAFWSYARKDDAHDYDALSKLRERLSGEVGALTGKDFPIWQDWKDVGWGDDWQEEIDKALAGSLFLIPVISPMWLASEACREEYLAFRRLEQARGRRDLILPLYYIEIDALEQKDHADEIVKDLARRQRESWLDLRFAALETERGQKAVNGVAKRLKAALDKPLTPPKPYSPPLELEPKGDGRPRDVDVEKTEYFQNSAQLAYLDVGLVRQLSDRDQVALIPDVQFGHCKVTLAGYTAAMRLTGAQLRLCVTGGGVDHDRVAKRGEEADADVYYQPHGAGADGEWIFQSPDKEPLKKPFKLARGENPGAVVDCEDDEVHLEATIRCEPENIEMDHNYARGTPPEDVDPKARKKADLTRNQIALWDILAKESMAAGLAEDETSVVLARQRLQSRAKDGQ